MNGYICTYKGKRIEVRSDTIYHAQQEAARVLKVKAKDEYKISVTLAERADGTAVVHSF
jgi:hypothetical protein